jgi:predicted dehydrogenase
MNANITAGRAVKIALVGCGSVSFIYHAPALVQLEQSGVVRVGGIFDPDGEAVARLTERFPSARRMSSPDDLSGMELAIVASPPAFHARQSIDALRAGVTVLCEKPMASSVKEGDAMIAAAAESRGLLAIALVRRFLPATQAIRSILANRMLGELRNVTCFEGGPFRWPARSPSFFDRSQGGVLLDVGAHMLDLLIWWLGVPDGVDYEDDAMGGVEANCRFVLRYDSGIRVVGRLSRDWELPNRYLFDCAKGWMSWMPTEPESVQIGFHDASFALGAELRDRAVSFGRPVAGRKSINFEQAFMFQIRNVLDAMFRHASLVAPGADALKSLHLIDECYRHRKLMNMAWFTDIESARARTEAGRVP